MQFVIQAINLYKDMVVRQDVMVKLLFDIRDKTKNFQQSSIPTESIEEDSEESEALASEPGEQSPFCYHCGAEVSEDTVQCSICGKKI